MRLTFVLILAFAGLVTAPAIINAKAPDFLENREVVILSASKSFDTAREDAVKISKGCMH